MNSEKDKISLRTASRVYGYTQQHLGLLCRQGKLKSVRVGKKRFTTKKWMDEYLKELEDFYKKQDRTNNDAEKWPYIQNINFKKFVPLALIPPAVFLFLFFVSRSGLPVYAAELKKALKPAMESAAEFVLDTSKNITSFSASVPTSLGESVRENLNSFGNKTKENISSFVDDTKRIFKNVNDGYAALPQKVKEAKEAIVEFFIAEQQTKIVEVKKETIVSSEVETIRAELSALKKSGLTVQTAVVERTIEKILSGLPGQSFAAAGITQNDLNNLNASLLSQIDSLKQEFQKQIQGSYSAMALTQRVNYISAPTITTPTISAPKISGNASLENLTTSGWATIGTTLSAVTAISAGTTLTAGATTTLASDLVVDTNTFFLNASSNKIGLGTTSPRASLHIGTTTPAYAVNDGDLFVSNIAEIGSQLYVNGVQMTGGGTLNLGFTNGSVVFSDSLGNLTQDNASFFYDDTNNRLGIGTTSPYAKLSVWGSSAGTAKLFELTNSASTSLMSVLENGQCVTGDTLLPIVRQESQETKKSA
ncbi:hypothetical protein KKB69_00565, partial [Patescibacteria group bacterium]|nr:hypothetical protein [Patescibacteria group bacterium]